jgi:hypothetical protein
MFTAYNSEQNSISTITLHMKPHSDILTDSLAVQWAETVLSTAVMKGPTVPAPNEGFVHEIIWNEVVLAGHRLLPFHNKSQLEQPSPD